MQQRDANSLTMINGVIKYMNDRAPKWNTFPDIVNTHLVITTKKNKIDEELGEVTDRQTGGITDELYAGLNTAIELTHKLSLKIALYAKKKGDLDLFSKVNFAKTELDDGKFPEIINRLNLIVDKVELNEADLLVYNVKPENIAEAREAIEAVKDKPAERKATGGDRIESNAAVSALIKEIKKIMREDLDLEVEALVEDAEFVKGYFAVRRIDDIRGGGSSKTPPTE